MPVCGVKGGERPGDTRETNHAIHNWVLLDVGGIIERDAPMSNHLRVNREGRYCQTEENNEISLHRSNGANRSNTCSVRRSNTSGSSLLRSSFGHLFERVPEDEQCKYLWS